MGCSETVKGDKYKGHIYIKVKQRGKVGGSRMGWEFGVRRCKLLHLEWISNEVLL